MNSSISSSEPADRRWRGFVATFAAAVALILATTLGLLAALDPYDSGRLALVRRPGVAQQGPRTANASRGRDPRFDAAIFGNSHIQLLRPETLKIQTGLDFVSLIVPGTHPKEQFALIDWFLRHHAQPQALVIGLDGPWCLDGLNSVEPFPFWLYDSNPLVYLYGLMRFSALEHVPGRVAVLLGRAAPARPDGYWDYGVDYAGLDMAGARAQFFAERPRVSANPRNAFPAADRLRAVLAALPAATRVVLVWPPVHVSGLAQPGSAAEATMQACRGAFASLAAAHARTAVVDWALDRPETRLAENFFDQSHYRGALAQALQNDVAAALDATMGPR
jgi:hypothetical protein